MTLMMILKETQETERKLGPCNQKKTTKLKFTVFHPHVFYYVYLVLFGAP